MANIIGPDVSFYQDEPTTPQGIDFVKMRASAEFVIIRAGQNLWPDSDFKYNWREAKIAMLPRGSYWFYDSRVAPKKQAELWVEQFEGDFGELPLCRFRGVLQRSLQRLAEVVRLPRASQDPDPCGQGNLHLHGLLLLAG